jgi:hypothetical protein
VCFPLAEGSTTRYDTSDQPLTFPPPGASFLLRRQQVAPNEKRIASAGWDGTVKVWDVESGAELLTLTGHRGEVYAVAFSPDGHQLASTGADRTLRVWDATLTPAMRYHEAALERVRALAAEVLVKDEVARRLREDNTLDGDFRSVALKLAEDVREDATKLNEASWVVVNKPGATPEAYALAVLQAKAACRLSPNSGDLLKYLRLGLLPGR